MPYSLLKSLLGIEQLSQQQAIFIIERAMAIKVGRFMPEKSSEHTAFRGGRTPNVALIFFESSTRTRFSFEIACRNLGLNPIVFTADGSTSLSKGESPRETLMTLLQMRPDMVVIRHSGDKDVEALVRRSQIPFVNAGDGQGEHPTQALLDAMTILEKLGSVEGQKVLYVGDVEHSRVARSGRLLLQKLGAEVAICCPNEVIPKSQDWSGIQRFDRMNEATRWATVCIGLRIQKERHGESLNLSQAEYVSGYRLDPKNLSGLSAKSIIMHPGPFVSGVDLDESILSDPRCVIHEQVTNGVFIRMAVIGDIFGLLGA